MSNKTYNIYCDESRVENRDSTNMAIGALVIPRNDKDNIVKEIKALKKQYGFYQEIKWNKVGKKYNDFYKRLLDFYIENEGLSFRGVIVNKTKVKYAFFHNDDEELAFYKFYFLLLKSRLENNSKYYIFLDKKPARDKNRARSLKAFLDAHVLFNRQQSQIQHLQAYDSMDNVLIQLADFLTGMIAFINNDGNEPYKSQIVNFLQNKLNISLSKTTPISSKKINLLIWAPKK